MARQPIDRDKLRKAVRKLSNESVFSMLEDAIELLPPTKLSNLAQKYFDVERFRPDGTGSSGISLLEEVKEFERSSLTGEYYQSFDVNSKNFMEMSRGTVSWITECTRLLDRCVNEAKKGVPAEVREAFDIIFGLLDRIDEGRDDVIFFADEAGAWQVGVDWDKVLPPWFDVLSATASPEEYAERIVGLIKNHYGYGSAKMLVAAKRRGTPDQRKALAKPSRRAS